MPDSAVPVDVVTEGANVIIDVPCGVPVTCGEGIFCGAALLALPPHPAASNGHREARTINVAAVNQRSDTLELRQRDTRRSSTRIPMYTVIENMRNQMNIGNRFSGGAANIVLLVVATLTT